MYTLRSLRYCIDNYLLYIKDIKKVSSNTVLAYSEDLKHLSAMLDEDMPITAVTVEDIRSCIASLSRQKYAARSINRFIVAVRGVFAYCKKKQYIQDNVTLDLKTLKEPEILPRFMTQGEIDELCVLPEKKEILWGTRDKALFEMFYSSGCRVSELLSLKLSDFTQGYKSAVVKGKGSKERYVFFEKDAVDALQAYLLDRERLFPASGKRGAKPVDTVFLNQQGGPLTANGVRYILRRYTGPEGTNKTLNPHAFRHTFATAMLLNGADVRVVQEMLGHESLNTTQRYTHLTTQRLKDVYRQAFPHSGKRD